MDPATVERVRSLAIPPAWTDVWISPHPGDHIQATGEDEAGRRQYLYHPRWQQRQARDKFDRAVRLGLALPALRRRLTRDLAGSGLDRERVLAGALRLLDLGLLRVGSPEYAERHGSIGLCTLAVEHVQVAGGEARLSFPGKAGVPGERVIGDQQMVRLIRALMRGRGPKELLFAYRGPNERIALQPSDVNVRLKELAGAGHDFTAKDFRTWHASVLYASELAIAGVPETARARERVIQATVATVAEELGNTPAVCRASYLDPRITRAFRRGLVIQIQPGGSRSRRAAETATLTMVSD